MCKDGGQKDKKGGEEEGERLKDLGNRGSVRERERKSKKSNRVCYRTST